MTFSPEIEQELDDAAKTMAEARGWTPEFARGVVEQVVACFAYGATETRRYCICGGPTHVYTPDWCSKPRFADADGRLLPQGL